MSHFLQACFYGSDVQMPSGLNWLPVITKPPPGRWEQEPWIGIRDTSSMILQVLCLSLAAGGLLVSCHSSILLSRSPLPLPSPHGHLHSHYMSNSLFPEYISLPYVPLSSPSIKPGKLLLICQTPNHFSSSRKHSQTAPITCSSIALQNRVHNSLISLRILIIITAKH